MQFMFVLVPLLIIVSEIVSVISPRTAWYMQEGWKFKNVEPSQAALTMARIGGVFAIIGGIVFLIISQNMFAGGRF